MVKVVKEQRTRVNEAIWQDAPDWHDTPLDELDFQWSSDEELEIERYCDKIHKNIAEAEEEMTPRERYEATMAGKPKDRPMISLAPANLYLSRVLDCGSDALKPVDTLRNPKLWVKGHLAFVARFNPDWPMYFTTVQSGVGLFGGRAKMIDYGQPSMVDLPVKSIEDLEGLELPDPRKDGMFPGYLWGCREMKRIFDEYDLSEVMPIWSSLCGGVEGMVMDAMMGWTPFMIAMVKDPELCRRATTFGLEWCIRFGLALIEESRPDCIQCCQATGAFPIQNNKWLADAWLDFAKPLKALSPKTELTIGMPSLPSFAEFTDVMIERGAVSPDTWNGGIMGPEAGMEKLIDYYREHNLFLSVSIPHQVLEDGPISAIEEECKKLCEYGKSHPKFSAGAFPGAAFWTPFHHIDAAVAAFKKYGKY